MMQILQVSFSHCAVKVFFLDPCKKRLSWCRNSTNWISCIPAFGIGAVFIIILIVGCCVYHVSTQTICLSAIARPTAADPYLIVIMIMIMIMIIRTLIIMQFTTSYHHTQLL